MREPQPLIADIERMWKELHLTLLPERPDAVEPLLAEFRRTHVNGGALFARFGYEPHPVLEWFVRTHRLTPPVFDFVGGLIRHPALSAALPELELDKADSERMGFAPLDAFDLEASLARALHFGGAYVGGLSDGSLSIRQAKTLAGAFTDAVEGDLRHSWFVENPIAWTPWFCDIAWDHTWIGLNTLEHSLWLLCVTDTD